MPRLARLRGLSVALLLAPSLALAPDPITIWMAGDSTMAEKQPDKRPETGWGESFGRFFRDGEVRIANRAMNGRSTRTFIAEHRWQAIVDSVQRGDYVFIQFGHNDESPEKVDRYTPPADFRANLTRMVNDVRAKGATPVLLTPVRRRKFDESGQLLDTHGEYPDLVRAVAAQAGVALIDMHRSSGMLLSRLGPDSSRALFLQLKPGENPNYPNGVDDNTHFRPRGADLMAGLAASELRGALPSLAAHLR
ncbi:MAG TPA: rhamnogalacturonan acetylesterase [Gemmatimonadaceae bacterium]|nr:rhamnogalacturonan acetylesterase [Gemmatimonadaceae bacterium]